MYSQSSLLPHLRGANLSTQRHFFKLESNKIEHHFQLTPTPKESTATEYVEISQMPTSKNSVKNLTQP